MLQVLISLGLAGSCDIVSTLKFPTLRLDLTATTYNRLANTSMPLVTAVLKRIMIQMLVKLKSRQNELGMSAERLFLTWWFIQQTKVGTVASPITNSAMVFAVLMLSTSAERVLENLLSVTIDLINVAHQTENTYANAYDKVTNPVLEMRVPTQSISFFNCSLTQFHVFGFSSFGNTNTPTHPVAQLAAATR
jgi:hypothetical protein